MKSLLSLLLICLAFNAYADDLEVETSASINTSTATLKEKQTAAAFLNSSVAKRLYHSLPEGQKEGLDGLLVKVKKSKDPLIEIVEGKGAPLLLVQGLDYNEDFPPEWIRPFHAVMLRDQPTYFFKWSKMDSIEENTKKLTSSIKTLLEKYAEENLTVVAYSAGGVIAISSLDQVSEEAIAKRIYLHTVAAPIFGYNAPKFALLGSPFAGKTAIQIGIGRFKSLHHKRFTQCSHWVTTSCELDKHACNNGPLNPQIGLKKEDLPCGEKNTKSYSDEGHASVIYRALNDILK